MIISCIVLECNDVTLASNFGINSTLQRKPTYDSLPRLEQNLGAWLVFCIGLNSIYNECQCADLKKKKQQLWSYWRKGKSCNFKWNLSLFSPLFSIRREFWNSHVQQWLPCLHSSWFHWNKAFFFWSLQLLGAFGIGWTLAL